LLTAALAAPSSARAQWVIDTVETTASSSHAFFGAAIRSWGPVDAVYIVYDEAEKTGQDALDVTNELTLEWYTYDDSTLAETHEDTDVIGSLDYRQAMQPSLAIRRKSASDPVELSIVRRERDDPANFICDGDSDPLDSEAEWGATDLLATLWEDTHQGGSGDEVSTSVAGSAIVSSSVCGNHGRNYARFKANTTPWACFTYRETGSDDQLGCNHAAWANAFYIAHPGSNDEDHPTFAFDDVAGQVLAGTERSGNNGINILTHFPDTSPPSPPEFARTGTSSSDSVDHADLLHSQGSLLQMVWRDGKEGDAMIRIAECDIDTSTDGCEDISDWTVDEDVDSDGVDDAVTSDDFSMYYDADFPVIQADGDKQFVLYHYNTNSSGVGDPDYKVVLATRCRGDTWTRQEIDGSASADQFIAYGKPALALNRIDNIAHVVYTEAAGYTGVWGVPQTSG